MKKKAFIYIILAGVLWGTSGIFVHYLAPMGFSSAQMAAMRGIVATISMSVYVFIKDKSLFRVKLKPLLLFAGGGIAMYLTGLTYYMSMQASSVSTAVVLMYTAPAMVMVYSVAFLGERLTRAKVLAVLGMLIGCALVSGIIGGMRFSVVGILLGLCAGVCYAIYNILTKIQMKQQNPPLSASMYCFLFMAITATLGGDVPGIVHTASQNTVAIPLIIGIGVCTSVVPYFLYTLALKDLPAGTASSLGIVEPMAATIYSIVLFHEPMTWASISGIILILGSVLLLSRIEA